jgi:integrase
MVPTRPTLLVTVSAAAADKLPQLDSQTVKKFHPNAFVLTNVSTPDVVGIVVRWTYLNASQELFRAIARNAGLGETLQHPHVLQHTAAMLLVQQGANAFLIRQALGHKSFDSRTLTRPMRTPRLHWLRRSTKPYSCFTK